jgi:AmmeMemoRadiSam system protein B
MAAVRPAAVAGRFYPGDPDRLRTTIESLLDAAVSQPTGLTVRMLIVPHAGYVYSGPVAAAAYRHLPPARRVVLAGPSHFVGFQGVAVPGATGLATPLGVVGVDAASTRRALEHDAVTESARAHAGEHCLEVQLPFLQVLLEDVEVVALLTSDAVPDAVAGVLDDLLDDDVVVVISSDLSHYLDDETARRRDATTAEAIEGLRASAIGAHDACGHTAVQAALLVARRHGWECRRLALGTSADTAGTPDRVVGYGAFAIGPV